MLTIKLIVLSLFSVTHAQQVLDSTATRKCHVLSLSGGGAKGAYEAGVLKTVTDMLSAEEAHYDVVSGVSVGSINAALLSLYGEGEDEQMADHLLRLWGDLSNPDVYTTWAGAKYNPIEPIQEHTGYLNNTPLFEYLVGVMKPFNNVVKRRTLVSAVDAISGDYVSFNLYDEPGAKKTSIEFKAKAVQSSASVPFLFPAANMTDYGYDLDLLDGGSAWNNNMVSAINECHKLEGITDDSQIVVDVIVLSPAGQLDPMNTTSTNPTLDLIPSTLKYYLRNKEIKDHYSDLSDIVEFMQANPSVTYRYYFSPEETLLPEYYLLQFDQEYTHKLTLWGLAESKKVIEAGPGKSFDKLWLQHAEMMAKRGVKQP